jgi:DNA-binding XRE family transcriptional regulator
MLLSAKKETNMFPKFKKATYVFTNMNSLLQQIKQRRLTLGLKQNDMMLRVGVSRQQYQRLESKGNPRLDTLELIMKGLNSELMLIPKEKLRAVLAVLEPSANNGQTSANNSQTSVTSGQSLDTSKGSITSVQTSPKPVKEVAKKSLSDDPWQDLLGNN